MAQDYYAILGLTPGRYSPEEIAGRFLDRRVRLLSDLDDPARHAESRRALDELHLAYAALHDPRSQEEYLQTHGSDGDPARSLRALIAASLEDGLLRHSRREAIIERGQELGVSEFQTQLLIAQVQFGEPEPPAAPLCVSAEKKRSNTRAWARVAGVGVLALTMFLYLFHWLGA